MKDSVSGKPKGLCCQGGVALLCYTFLCRLPPGVFSLPRKSSFFEGLPPGTWHCVTDVFSSTLRDYVNICNCSR